MNRARPAIPMGFVVLLGTIALSACDRPPQTGQAQADAETRAACRARADEAYNQQNRGEIYAPPPTVNTPFSSNYTTTTSNRNLSDLFAHDRRISDCVRNTGTNSDRTLPPSPPPQP
jgi:hypothetical protein